MTRVTGHLKLIERRDGPVWFVKTRVPGRRPPAASLPPTWPAGSPPPGI